MGNPSKAKGDRWERALVTYFRELGFVSAARLRQTGENDEGDLTLGSPLWAIEAKDDQSMSPWAMCEQAEREARNAGKPFGVAVRKSPRRPTGEAVVMMTMSTWIKLVRYMEGEDDGIV